jgi:Icc-related predicted phosphoesterase
MKIQVISDVHLEFSGMERDLDCIAEVERDLLIVAGDLSEGLRGEMWLRRQAGISPVVYVTGNHEYYGYDIDLIDKSYRALDADVKNFHFLQKGVYEQDGVRIAGCTFWTDMQGVNEYEMGLVRRTMADWQVIQKDSGYFTPHMSVELHHDHKEWLREQKDIDIVVTHHAPSRQSITPYWLEHGKLLNPAFAADADDLIEQMAPTYWIHGHMHSFLRYWHNKKINGTQVLCNPVGYGGSYQERSGWNDKLLISIDK